MHHHESEHKYVNHVVAEETTRGFNPGERDTIYVNLTVPAIPPTDSASRIVKVDYSIRVRDNYDNPIFKHQS